MDKIKAVSNMSKLSNNAPWSIWDTLAVLSFLAENSKIKVALSPKNELHLFRFEKDSVNDHKLRAIAKYHNYNYYRTQASQSSFFNRRVYYAHTPNFDRIFDLATMYGYSDTDFGGKLFNPNRCYDGFWNFLLLYNHKDAGKLQDALIKMYKTDISTLKSGVRMVGFKNEVARQEGDFWREIVDERCFAQSSNAGKSYFLKMFLVSAQAVDTSKLEKFVIDEKIFTQEQVNSFKKNSLNMCCAAITNLANITEDFKKYQKDKMLKFKCEYLFDMAKYLFDNKKIVGNKIYDDLNTFHTALHDNPKAKQYFENELSNSEKVASFIEDSQKDLTRYWDKNYKHYKAQLSEHLESSLYTKHVAYDGSMSEAINKTQQDKQIFFTPKQDGKIDLDDICEFALNNNKADIINDLVYLSKYNNKCITNEQGEFSSLSYFKLNYHLESNDKLRRELAGDVRDYLYCMSDPRAYGMEIDELY